MDFTSIYKCSSFFFNTINKNKTKQNNKNIQNTTNFLKDACQNKTSHELIVIENFQEKKKTRTKEYFFGRRRNVTAVGGQSNQEKKNNTRLSFSKRRETEPRVLKTRSVKLPSGRLVPQSHLQRLKYNVFKCAKQRRNHFYLRHPGPLNSRPPFIYSDTLVVFLLLLLLLYFFFQYKPRYEKTYAHTDTRRKCNFLIRCFRDHLSGRNRIWEPDTWGLHLPKNKIHSFLQDKPQHVFGSFSFVLIETAHCHIFLFLINRWWRFHQPDTYSFVLFFKHKKSTTD